jgi:hypothetical protein
MSKRFELAICCLLILSCSACGQKAEIYGKWYFDRFGGPHSEVVEDGEIARANKLNKGLSFTFTKDDGAIYEQADGAKMNAPFHILPGRKGIVLHGDTLKIMLLTPDILELFPVSGTKPAMFLKRS